MLLLYQIVIIYTSYLAYYLTYYLAYGQIKSAELYRHIYTVLAGVVGIEPTLTVLETAVLPLYDTPITLGE